MTIMTASIPWSLSGFRQSFHIFQNVWLCIAHLLPAPVETKHSVSAPRCCDGPGHRQGVLRVRDSTAHVSASLVQSPSTGDGMSRDVHVTCRPSGGHFLARAHGPCGQDQFAGMPRERHRRHFRHLQYILVMRYSKGCRSRTAYARSPSASPCMQSFKSSRRRFQFGVCVVVS